MPVADFYPVPSIHFCVELFGCCFLCVQSVITITNRQDDKVANDIDPVCVNGFPWIVVKWRKMGPSTDDPFYALDSRRRHIVFHDFRSNLPKVC